MSESSRNPNCTKILEQFAIDIATLGIKPAAINALRQTRDSLRENLIDPYESMALLLTIEQTYERYNDPQETDPRSN